ncbi:C40 family peptidase [Rhizomonospora bruguierae]|uniref:C40 family peptidase n=1 Tax=Rhizomonospora bruguierae TaxID=1581705 RepID=UPI001BD17D1E|nr:C40 family peptidase [Micromonospora sp. NBRC 107566]
MTVEAGQRATVAVAVATLWSAPDAVGPVDRPALGPVTDIRAWVAGLPAAQQIRDSVLSQLLLGEAVRVEEVRDGWARVVAPGQPAARLHADGYPGWLPVAHLAAYSPAGDLVVNATATALRDEPDGDVVLGGVVLGTRLTPAGERFRGWQPVLLPGAQAPVWAVARDLATLPAEPPAADRVLEVAARLLGVTYVWGGLSGYGIDCSGLVHLAWRRFGVTLPRDASEQAAATTPLEFGEERPGDLYFFARPGKKIHHVGLVTAEPGDGARHMLHACYTSRKVTAEPVRGERAATLVAAHRVPAAG